MADIQGMQVVQGVERTVESRLDTSEDKVVDYPPLELGPKALESLKAANRGEFDGSANSVEEMMEKLNARR